MKKYVIWASVLLLAVGCSSFQTATYEEEMAMPLKENGVDTLFYSISLEYVTGGLPKEACKQINDMLLTTAFGLEDAPGTVEESAIRYRENLIDEYLTENNSSELPAGLLTWGDEIKGSFAADWNKNKCYAIPIPPSAGERMACTPLPIWCSIPRQAPSLRSRTCSRRAIRSR